MTKIMMRTAILSGLLLGFVRDADGFRLPEPAWRRQQEVSSALFAGKELPSWYLQDDYAPSIPDYQSSSTPATVPPAPPVVQATPPPPLPPPPAPAPVDIDTPPVPAETTLTAPQLDIPELPVQPLPTTPVPITETLSPLPESVQSSIENFRKGYFSFLDSIRDAPRSPGSAPSFVDYIKSGKFSPDTLVNKFNALKEKSLNLEAVQKMQFDFKGLGDEQMEAIKAFKIDPDKFKSGYDQIAQTVPIEKLSTSLQSFYTILQTKGLQASPEALDALNFRELGGWYVGGIGLVLALSQGSTGSSSRKELESKLNETTTKLMEEEMEAESKIQSVLSEKERMEQQVVELSKATAAVSKELKDLKTNKASQDYAVAEMKSELRTLQNRLQTQKTEEEEIRSMLKKKEAELEKTTAALEQQLKEKEALAEALQKQLAELESKLGATTAVPEKAAPKAKKSESVPAPAPVFFAAIEDVVEAPAQPEASKSKKSSKKSKSKQKEVEVVSKETRAPSKSKGEESPADDDDWSSLSEAALKRKTVQELKDFLESKGAPTTGPDGKVMKKAELVDAVKSAL